MKSNHGENYIILVERRGCPKSKNRREIGIEKLEESHVWRDTQKVKRGAKRCEEKEGYQIITRNSKYDSSPICSSEKREQEQQTYTIV